LIESNYRGIGSGVMGGSTGIMLQNRGTWFSLDPGHVNVIAPGKRTMHTLMPGMAFRGDRPWLVFGTMGGSMQAQIHVELLTRMLDRGMTIDEALDAPRFDAVLGSEVGKPVLAVEGREPPGVLDGLGTRGNAVRVWPSYTAQAGHAHAIEVLESGAYAGAADPRTESLALGF
jgi:gamma-glutamyltranspeptidase/glutathione hydrolase